MDTNIIWSVLNLFGVDVTVIRLLKTIYRNSQAVVRVGYIGEWFGQRIETRQGDPIIFIMYVEQAMDTCKEDRGKLYLSSLPASIASVHRWKGLTIRW